MNKMSVPVRWKNTDAVRDTREEKFHSETLAALLAAAGWTAEKLKKC